MKTTYPKQRKINIKDPYGKITHHHILALTENNALFLSGYIDITPPSTPTDYQIITDIGNIPTTTKLMIAVNTLTNESNQIGINSTLQTNKLTLKLTPHLVNYPSVRLCFTWIIPL